MERLTIHLRDGITRCTKVSTDLCYEHSNCFDCEMYRRMADRLAAYEDTGLTPEEVVQMAQELRKMKETARGDSGGQDEGGGAGMKSVLISIQPKWCELIASGKKTVEVRKTRPKLEPPFKVYIYCTKGAPYLNWRNGICYLESKDILGGHGPGLYKRLSGLVIGEFVCKKIDEYSRRLTTFQETVSGSYISKVEVSKTCLSIRELNDYFLGGKAYFWHISNLKMYDKPRSLGDFNQCHKCDLSEGCRQREYSCAGYYKLKSPPQSWCYVEELP